GHDRQGGRELAFQDVQVGAAQAAGRDLDHHLAGAGRRVVHALDADHAGGADDDCLHLTAPRERPWTSLSWAAKPATSTGTEMHTAAAHTLARNRPWLVTKPVRKTGAVPATTPVSTRANSSSFQLKMKEMSAVAAMPGAATGATMRSRTVGSPAPSMDAASRISPGTSARKERIIHTAIGRFMDV